MGGWINGLISGTGDWVDDWVTDVDEWMCACMYYVCVHVCIMYVCMGG